MAFVSSHCGLGITVSRGKHLVVTYWGVAEVRLTFREKMVDCAAKILQSRPAGPWENIHAAVSSVCCLVYPSCMF